MRLPPVRPPRLRMTLRTRLSMLYAAVFLLGAAALLVATVSLVDRTLARSYQSAVVADALNKKLNEAVPSAAPVASSGADASPSQPAGGGAPDAARPSKNGAPSNATLDQIRKDKAAAALRSQLVKANLEYNAQVQTAAVHNLVNQCLVVLAILVPLTAVGGWLLAGRALRPVSAITDSARQASEYRLSERLSLGGPRDEITELADTFDAMLDRLEHAFDAQRRFTADASHELRTPLAVARTAIEVVFAKPQRTPQQLEEMAQDVHTALDRAERLVDSLLTLTRSQHLVHGREAVDLATIAEDALDLRTSQVASSGITVRAELEPAPTAGDRNLLDRLVANLVDNAIRYNTPPGLLHIRTGRDADGAFVSVANDGPVVEPDRVPALFEPFQRGDGRARSHDAGLGLGLAIVHSVAEAHHATVDAVARPDGGLAITVRLPDHAPPDGD